MEADLYNQFYSNLSLFDQPSTPINQDVLTSWFEDAQDESYSPELGDEMVEDLQMLLDDNFFQFNMTGSGANSLKHLPPASHYQHPPLQFPNPSFYLQNNITISQIKSLNDLDDTSIDFLDSTMQTYETKDHQINQSSVSSPDQDEDINISISMPTTPQSEDEMVEMCKREATSARASSKNLVSERNRRKRLSRQLLALRALVPNITKMDKRSVLVDALAYLRSIHEEMELLEAELTARAPLSGYQTSMGMINWRPSSSVTANTTKLERRILKIDIEKMAAKRFALKVASRGGHGTGGEILGILESLGFEITYAAIEENKPGHTQMTMFIKVRKEDNMTEEKLKNNITKAAIRLGFIV